MLIDISNFLQKHGESILTKLVQFAGWVVTHLREIISAIIAFKVASVGLMITQIATIAASNTVAGWLGAGGVVAATGVGLSAVAGLEAYKISNAMMMADGGYVPSTPGGQLAVIGEGGEGEYVIPESKMGAFGGNSYNITVNSYSPEETDRMVRSIIRDEVSESRLRSGF